MFQFHHVALSVSDINQSKKFYHQLGFQTALEWKAEDSSLEITHLTLNSIVLELFCFQEHISKNNETLKEDLQKLGVKHFGLRVDSIEAAKNQLVEKEMLKAEDVNIQYGRTGITYFFIKDPDENFVEIVEDNRSFISK